MRQTCQKLLLDVNYRGYCDVLLQEVTAGSFCSKLLLGDTATGCCWVLLFEVTAR